MREPAATTRHAVGRAAGSRRTAGQATLSWVAMLALAAVVATAVVGIWRHAEIERVAATAYCRVAAALAGGGGGVCAADGMPGRGTPGSPDGQGSDQPWYCDWFGVGCSAPQDEGGDDQPEDADKPWYCDWFGIGCPDTSTNNGGADVPDGLDPDSELVKTLQSTERGRATLQWLHDHHIPIELRDDVQGAYWDGTTMVIGKGYDDPSVIVHETNHAKATENGTSADADRQSRDDYVRTAINEEVSGTVQQIQAAKEFRAAGHDVGPQPLEDTYDAAYQAARQGGASEADAQRAGSDAVSREFFAGHVRTSTTQEPYTDYYGHYWDSRH